MAYWGTYYDPAAISSASSMTPWDAYKKAQTDWNNIPIDQRLKARGYGFTMDDTGGFWTDQEGNRTFTGDGSPEIARKEMESAAAFDPRQFVDQYRILPLSGKYNGNIDYTDSSIASQGKGDLKSWLSFTTNNTGGTIYTDPQGNQWFVPKDPSSLDPYKDFAQHSGGWLTDLINNFVGGGGLVNVLAGNVLSGAGALSSLADAITPAGAGAVEKMITNAAINAGTQALTTGNVDPSKVLASVVGGAAGSEVSQGVQQATDSSLAASIAGSAVKGALSAAITGGDPIHSAAASAASSGLGSLAKDAGVDIPQPVINSVVGAVASGTPATQALANVGTSVLSNLGGLTQAPAPVSEGVPSVAPADTSGLASLTQPAQQPMLAAADTGTTTDVTAPTTGALNVYGAAPADVTATGQNAINQITSQLGTVQTPSGLTLPAVGSLATMVPNSDGTTTYTFDDGSTIIYDANGNVVDSTPSTDQQVAATTDQPVIYQNQYTGSSVSDTGQVPPVIGDYSAPVNTGSVVIPSAVSPLASVTPAPVDTGVAPTADSSGYHNQYTGSYVSDTGQVPPVIGDYQAQQLPTVLVTDQTQVPAQQMPEVLVTAQQPATAGLPAASPLPDSGGANAPVAANVPVTTAVPVAVTVPVASAPSGTSTASETTGVSGALPGALSQTDTSNYPSPIKAYLQPNWLFTGSPVQVAPLWGGLTVQQASIPAAHGGVIHPRLMKILQERSGELVPGPENRMYMRHAKRGFAVNGPGTGQSDDIPTMLADGEYVFDADTVAALGDGSSKAGAEVLDKMREAIRAHKRSAPVDKIPPKAKSPLEYLKMAKRK